MNRTMAFQTPDGTVWLGGYSAQSGYSIDSLHLHPDQHAFIFSYANPNVIYCGSDGGVASLTNPSASNTTWSGKNNGYVTGQFLSVAIDRQTTGNPFAIGGLQDNGTWATDTLDPSKPWSGDYSGGDGCLCAVAQRNNTLCFVGVWRHRRLFHKELLFLCDERRIRRFVYLAVCGLIPTIAITCISRADPVFRQKYRCQ